MRRVISSKQTMAHAASLQGRIYLIPPKFSRYHQSSTLLAAGVNRFAVGKRHSSHRPGAPGLINMIAEASVTSETEAVITLKPEIDDLVPSEGSPRQSVGDPASVASFPKVLRRRLDK